MTSGHFICRNKYYGRSLSEEGFRRALLQFLHTGEKVRLQNLSVFLYKKCKVFFLLKNQD